MPNTTEYPRLNIHVILSKNAEAEAEAWLAKTVLTGEISNSEKNTEITFHLSTKRDFANALYIMNVARSSGYNLAISRFGVVFDRRIKVSENPIEFWQKMAIAQMWC